jgi:hypothetical protein
MIPTHHAGKFLPKTIGFFPHDFILKASVVGESVIGHGIGGKVSQLKWRDLLKASCWSKRRRSVVTRSHSHSTSDGYEIQVRQRHVLYGIPYVGYPLPH